MRVRPSRAFASLSLRFGFPISRSGPHFADRKTLQGWQMAYEKQGCQSDEPATAWAAGLSTSQFMILTGMPCRHRRDGVPTYRT